MGALCGVDLALGTGRGGRRSASRAAIAGVAIATTAGVGALVVGASVDRLVRTPALFGWTWDYTTESGVAELLADDPSVESVGLVNASPITIDGRPVTTRGIASLKGELPLLLVEGRAAQAGEVVLGARTMDDLGVRIGDTVVASGSLAEQELRVVGQAVFAGVLDAPEAGWGAALPLAELEELGTEGDSSDGAVIALADGADRTVFEQRLAALGADAEVAEEPMELQRLREVEGFPWLLTAFLVAVGLMATAHAIFVTSHRRRGDLAVLRAMGLGRRGVYEALSVQAGTLALVGILIGIPLGVVAGRGPVALRRPVVGRRRHRGRPVAGHRRCRRNDLPAAGRIGAAAGADAGAEQAGPRPSRRVTDRTDRTGLTGRGRLRTRSLRGSGGPPGAAPYRG